MDVPARLKWIKESDRFVAYPVGTTAKGRFASITLQKRSLNTDRTPHAVEEIWRWVVFWDGWFSSAGTNDTKQAAADRATEEWWKLVQTEIPRNVDLEASMVVARVLVSPIPNSLLAEDTGFLHKVMQHLTDLYRTEIARSDLPGQVEVLMARLSEELLARRKATPEPERTDVSVGGGYRPRRRR